MRIGIAGATGSGKSLTAAMLMKELHEKMSGRKVFSNIWLRQPHSKIPDKFWQDWKAFDADFHNCIMLIDELHVYWNSRNFMSKPNKNIAQFFVQTRKRGDSDLIATFQLMRQIDILGRENFEMIIHCEPFHCHYKNDTDYFRGVKDMFDLRLTIYRLDQGNIKGVKVKILKWDVLKDYFKEYNTEEMVYYKEGATT